MFVIFFPLIVQILNGESTSRSETLDAFAWKKADVNKVLQHFVTKSIACMCQIGCVYVYSYVHVFLEFHLQLHTICVCFTLSHCVV